MGAEATEGVMDATERLNLDALRRDLEWYDMQGERLLDVSRTAEAARLVAEGQPVWWCEEHGAGFVNDRPDDCPSRRYDAYLLKGTPIEAVPCRMVEVLLVKGAER